jgi:hypothetical protein
MATKRPRGRPTAGYEKVSATLERPVVRMIREHAPNVSAFLNAAAKEKLYFERALDSERALAHAGVPFDEELYQRLRSAIARPARRRRASARR